MNMVRIAVAAALGAVSAPALAVGPVPAGNDLVVAGATATDRVFAEVALAADAITNAAVGICVNAPGYGDASIAEVYTQATNFGPDYKNYTIVCQGNAASGLSGQVIALSKSAGGSSQGVGNVANGVAETTDSAADRAWVDYVSCEANAGIPFADVGGPGTGRIRYRLKVGCPTLASRVPRIGISDVEPRRAIGSSGTAISRLTAQATVDVPFAAIVSANLYTALQSAQGITPNGAASANTEANMPNLTRAQLRGVFTGDTVTADQLDPGLTGDIYVCRRSNTSGTQAAFNIEYLGNACSASFRNFVTADASGAWPPANPDTVFVHGGSGSTDVRRCLDYRNDNGQYGIGIISTENIPTDTNDQWRYIKIDGVAPTVENIIRGRYAHWTTNTINTPNSSSPNVFNPATEGNLITLSNAIKARLQEVIYVRAALVGPTEGLAMGLGGIVARPNGGTRVPPALPITTTNAAANPVNSSVRAADFTSAIDNCQLPNVKFDTEVLP
jgi:hypothetical protein